MKQIKTTFLEGESSTLKLYLNITRKALREQLFEGCFMPLIDSQWHHKIYIFSFLWFYYYSNKALCRKLGYTSNLSESPNALSKLNLKQKFTLQNTMTTLCHNNGLWLLHITTSLVILTAFVLLISRWCSKIICKLQCGCTFPTDCK